MIDVCLLAKIARQHIFGDKYPETIQDAKQIYNLCFDVLHLWELLQAVPYHQIGGSETKVKQILAEYLKQMYERNSGDS